MSNKITLTKLTTLNSGYEVHFKHEDYWQAWHIHFKLPVGIKKKGDLSDIVRMDEADHKTILKVTDDVIGKISTCELDGSEMNENTIIHIMIPDEYRYYLGLRRGVENIEESYGEDNGCDLMVYVISTSNIIISYDLYRPR